MKQQLSFSRPDVLHLSRPNFWSKLSKTPVSQNTQYSFASTLVDISQETSNRTKSRPSLLKHALITQVSPSVTELDVTSSRETPFKDSIVSRRSPIELESLLSNINPCKASSRSTVRLGSVRNEGETVRLGNYLDYLGNGSNRHLKAFRSKMIEKMEPRKLGKVYKNWLDDMMPSEVKEATSLNDISARVNTVGNVNLQVERSGSEMKRPIHYREYKENKGVESCVEAAMAGKLAEDLARNYRVCKEFGVNNEDVMNKLKEIIEQEGVLLVFKRKVHKNLKLPVRIYRDMVEWKEQDGNGRVMSVERMASEVGDQMNLLRKQGKVIRSRYNVYKRVNERIEKLNMEYQVNKVKMLENNLLQAHESLRNRKIVTLGKIAKVDEGRYNKLKLECENVEKLVPMHGEVGEEKRKGMLCLRKGDGSKVALDIRKINKRLNRAVKNLQGSLLDVGSFR